MSSLFYVNKAKEVNVSKGLTLVAPRALAEKTPVNAVAASGVLTISDTPVAEESLWLGANVWLFKALRGGAGEITIDANTTTQAENIVAAITADAADIVATNLANVITIVAAVKGVVGNAIACATAATGCTLSSLTGGKLDGGVDGTSGEANETCADASYLYHCVAANNTTGTNWRRVSLGSAY